jgi:hypothetical protein
MSRSACWVPLLQLATAEQRVSPQAVSYDLYGWMNDGDDEWQGRVDPPEELAHGGRTCRHCTCGQSSRAALSGTPPWVTDPAGASLGSASTDQSSGEASVIVSCYMWVLYSSMLQAVFTARWHAHAHCMYGCLRLSCGFDVHSSHLAVCAVKHNHICTT